MSKETIHKSKLWWQSPYRLIQTNLRMPDVLYPQKALAREAREFGATALLYNIGGIYAFYPTQLELQAVNPMMRGDALGDAIEAAHAEGLALVGRFDMSKGTKIAYDAQPEWFVHNAAGRALEYNGTYQACVNSGWYQEYAFEIISEALGKYDVDGVFFNMFGYTNFTYSGGYFGICVCDNCQSRFRDMYGHDLPQTEDFSDPAYPDYLEFQDRTAMELQARVYDHIHDIAPHVAMTGHRGKSDLIRMEVQRAVHRPQPEWPYQAGEQARWARAYQPEKTASATSTNFVDFAWRFHSETAAYHKLRMAQQLANGMTLDLYLLGVLDQEDKRPLNELRALYKWHEDVEQHYHGLSGAAKVALYHSIKSSRYAKRTHSGAKTDVIFGALSGGAVPLRGYYRALLEERIPFDFVSDEVVEGENGLEALARFDVVVLPSVACLSDVEAEVLDAFVENGGTLVLTGESAMFDARGLRRNASPLKSFPGIGPITEHPDMKGAYFRVQEDEFPLPDSRVVMLDGRFWNGTLRPDASTLLSLLPPQRFGPPELCYPEAESDLPGVVIGTHGKGRAIWLPWQPEIQYFRDSLPSHRTIMTDLIARHLTPPEVILEGAGPVEVTLQKQASSGNNLVHLINYSGQRNNLYEEPPKLHGLRLGLRSAKGSTVQLLRSGISAPLGQCDDDGVRWIDLPPIGDFEVVVFKGS